MLLLVGTFTDPADIERAITTQVQGLVGQAGAEQVRTIIVHSRRTSLSASVTAVIGGVALLLGATTAFAQLQDALNKVWEVKPDPRRGQIGGFLMKRVFSFGLVLALGFLLLVSLSVSAALVAFSGVVTARLGVPAALVEAVNWLFSLVVITALFAVMFKYLPDARIAWRHVWVGALGTALLFVAGRTVIGYYLGRSDPGSAYGAAGSLAIVMIWVYYSSMILLSGAEFTRVWSERKGDDVKPEAHAVEVVEEEHAVRRG
jgi:membrane protein